MAKALRVLKTRLYEAHREEEHRRRSDERKTMIGSGDRSQRIRTYNFPQNRLTDHRLNQNWNLENVIAGNLDQVIDALLDAERQEQRAAFGTKE
jgi:peptide chain release factor 1